MNRSVFSNTCVRFVDFTWTETGLLPLFIVQMPSS